MRCTGSKADRAQPLAAEVEGGAVKLLRGPWNKDFLDEMKMFPFGPHDDQIDAASLALVKAASSSCANAENNRSERQTANGKRERRANGLR